MEFIIPISYLILVAIHAYCDKVRTKNDKPVSHGWGSFYYVMASICLLYAYGYWVYPEHPFFPAELFILPILTRAAFFDPLYNKFIGKHWLFEGVKKSKRLESWFDRLERNIGLPTAVYRLAYLAAYFIYLGIYIFQYK